MRRDQRSDAAKAYRNLYNTAAWKRARQAQLQAHPLCERCEKAGFIVAASVVNHRKTHKGDTALFLDPENHQSACQPCHDQAIQSDERTGKTTTRVGVSRGTDTKGWPTDPRHAIHR